MMTTTPRPDHGAEIPPGQEAVTRAAADDWRRHAHATAWWTGGASLALLGATGLVAASWADDLPDPVATHWSGGAGAGPDGFSSLAGAVLTGVGIGAAVTAVLSAFLWSAGRAAATRRTLAAVTVWVAGLISLALVGTLSTQRGLADAHEAGSVDAVLGAALLLPLLPAAVAALLVHPDPPLPATDDVADDAPRTALRPGERAAWVGRASGTAVPAVVLGTTILLAAVTVAAQLWSLLVIDAVLLVLLASTASFRVDVSARGLSVRSVLGWPRILVPADEIERADRIEVRALREFGGYGWRLAPGRRSR